MVSPVTRGVAVRVVLERFLGIFTVYSVVAGLNGGSSVPGEADKLPSEAGSLTVAESPQPEALKLVAMKRVAIKNRPARRKGCLMFNLITFSTLGS